jgi:DNA-binding NarL/FixJ family response regulator
MRAIRVVLADDHSLFRAGIRSLLSTAAGVQVVGEASEGYAALTLIRKERPDIAILDISMPGLRGLELAAVLHAELPEVRVMILSMHSGEEYVWRALKNGAAGYLLKDALEGELELAIRSVAQGGTYLTPAISRAVVEQCLRRGGAEIEAGEPLTARQKEVAQLIAEGHSSREIARILNISQKTVETNRTQLMQRLDIHDLAGLVRYAIRIGLVSAEK